MGIKSAINKMAKKTVQENTISEQELHNLRLRTGNKEQKEFELYIINNELRNYMNLVLQKYGKEGNFNINLANGAIEEVKKPTVEAKPQ